MKRNLAFIFISAIAGCSQSACAESLFSDSFEGEGKVSLPVEYCDQTGIKPEWMGATIKSWTQMFSAWDGSPKAVYPYMVSFPVAAGSLKFGYVAVPFTPIANQSVNLYWDQVQSRPQDGYWAPRPADGMFFSISPCAGDMRAGSWVSPDLWLHDGCRKYETSASIVWTTNQFADPLNLSLCTLEAGKQYYLNIAPVNPYDGLVPGEHTCANVPNSINECHVGAVSSAGK
jgi:hypothetical protein